MDEFIKAKELYVLRKSTGAVFAVNSLDKAMDEVVKGAVLIAHADSFIKAHQIMKAEVLKCN
jgi:hypothetical protein